LLGAAIPRVKVRRGRYRLGMTTARAALAALALKSAGLCLGLVALLLAGCSGLPPLPDRVPSHHLTHRARPRGAGRGAA